MRTVFITGATGFVGSHAAGLFLAQGWRVRALVRNPARPGLLPPGAEIVPGDLATGDYRRSLEGCEAVVHVAGLTKARNLAEYSVVNARATASLVGIAAGAAPAARFVLVSSQSAAGPSRGGVPVREGDPPAPVSWYGASKLAGEIAVVDGWKGPWCVVRPSVVYGPGDRGLLQLFSTIARGWAPILAGGRRRVQLIGADELARVLLAAATRPELWGRRGFAAGPPVEMGELVEYVAALRRPPARRLPIPEVVVRAAGWAETIREALTRKSRPFNRDKAREMLQEEWVCDAEPFLRDAQVGPLAPWREGKS